MMIVNPMDKKVMKGSNPEKTPQVVFRIENPAMTIP
jgi:hypothetical protein